MIVINDSHGTVLESHGVQATSAFNIARTPHMFRILSSGLYADKVSAVLREISCNATDAHIMHGTPERPIEVKLPTSLDRSFYVKDWGPGLDDQEVRELYTTYGWSNKQQNNEVTGGFGLGSKSPFAYTLQNEDDADGFTVESVKDGFKRIYTCFIAESGAPAISRLYEGPSTTDWPHGVKVSFSVQQRHVGEFQDRAREVFRWFSVLPEILGLDTTLPIDDFQFNGEGYSLASRNNPGSTACVVMGNVRYPIASANLRDVTTTEAALLDAGVVLRVPLGTVMMVPSREGLEYTDRTRAGIKRYLALAVESLAQQLVALVTEPAESTWLWFKHILTFSRELPTPITLALADFLQQAGMAQDKAKRILALVGTQVAVAPAWLGTELVSSKVWHYCGVQQKSAFCVSRKTVYRGRVGSGLNPVPLALDYLKKVKVVYADCTSADARVRHAIRQGDVDVVILVAGSNVEEARLHAERLCSSAELEGLPCCATSSLVKPTANRDGGSAKGRSRGLTLKDTHGTKSSEYVSVCDLSGGPDSGDVVLNDLPDECRYYVCQRNKGGYREEHFNTHKEQSGWYHIAGYARTATMKALHLTLPFLDQPVHGYLVVPSESAARRMKLADLGFKPLLNTVVEQLLMPGQMLKLVGAPRVVPYLPPAASNSMAHECGIAGTLAQALRTPTPVGEALIQALEGHPILAVALGMLTPSGKELVPSVRTLVSGMGGIPLIPGLQCPTTYGVKQAMTAAYPLTALLKLDDIFDVEPEQLSRVVAMVSLACGPATIDTELTSDVGCVEETVY